MKKLSVIILVLLALVSLFVAYIYFTTNAGSLPHFYPGYAQGSLHKHTKHGIAFISLAVVFLLGAWMASANKTSKPAAPKADKPDDKDETTD